ncbi:hypothetical protein F4809DRAFT_641115 [Biscogniauxia mediterranea]|nr:hypothetical protein F4809DRAFT_641115 [Biscogniauxia mediterranea]
MCLKIITHSLACDIRPVMPHPTKPSEFVVDPFSSPEDCCCCSSKSSGCAAHGCCQVTSRTFPCDCGNIVSYHRYTPSKPPCAFTMQATVKPGPGVWRHLLSIDDVLARASPQQMEHLPSEELRIARRGMKFKGADLGPKARELIQAVREKKRLESHSLDSGTYVAETAELNALCKELERIESEAQQLKSSYKTWKHMKERLEMQEYGKVFAVEMLA